MIGGRVSFDDFRVSELIPAWEYGSARVEHEEFEGGVIARLVIGGVVWMGDSLAEYLDHAEVLERAHGRVLVNGLGLGCVVKAMLAKPEVESVEVVELNRDVIELIGPFYADPRVKVIHADAFMQAGYGWAAGDSWDVVWTDILAGWHVTDDAKMELIESMYESRCGWHGIWRDSPRVSPRVLPEWVDGFESPYEAYE